MAISNKAKNEVLVESGFSEHNLLVYHNLDSFSEIYCMYAQIHLEPKYDEIVLIVTQYETPDRIRNNLLDYGVDVKKHEKDGSLVIVDSVKGYQGSDVDGVKKLARSLVARAEKEGKQGVAAFGDMGSFFMYDRLVELVQYESSIPTRPSIKIKTFCSYHSHDFGMLTDEQKKTIESNHLGRIKMIN